jgi:hypothetical protein
MKTWFAIAVAAAMVTLGTSCGGNDPFVILGDQAADPANTLSLPFDPALIGAVTPYTSTQDGIGIGYSGSFGSPTANVVAPLGGMIVNVDTSSNSGFFAVTIFHNAHLTTKLSFLQISTARPGDYVATGDIIGTLNNFTGSGVKLSVFVDGSSTAVCPLSYLTQSARAAYSGHGGVYPCQ